MPDFGFMGWEPHCQGAEKDQMQAIQTKHGDDLLPDKGAQIVNPCRS